MALRNFHYGQQQFVNEDKDDNGNSKGDGICGGGDGSGRDGGNDDHSKTTSFDLISASAAVHNVQASL